MSKSASLWAFTIKQASSTTSSIFFKIEAGQLFIDSIPFNSLATFQDAWLTFKVKAAEKQLNLSMSVDPAGKTPPLRGDPLRLFKWYSATCWPALTIRIYETGSVSLTVATCWIRW